MFDFVRSGGIARALESRNFRIFFYGNLVSVVGAWINRLALGWLTWQLTGSTAWLGIMAAAGMVPMILFGPFAGTTADRFGYRRQLVISSSISAVTAWVLAVLVVFDWIGVETLFVLVVVIGVTRAFNLPPRSALVSSVVERRHLSAAIAVNHAAFHTGSFLGPALGGFILAAAGTAAAFFIFGAGMFFSVATIVALRIEGEHAAKSESKSLIEDFRAGVAYAFQHTGIRMLIVMSAAMPLFFQSYAEMLPGFASEVFHRGADGFAVLSSAAGLGAMCGGLWLAQRGRIEGLTNILVFSVFVGGGGLLAFTATDVFAVAVVSLFFVGLSLVGAMIGATSLIQYSVDGAFRARVLGMSGVLFFAGPAFGAIAIGWAATHLGVRPPVALSATIGLALGLFFFARLRRLAPELERGSEPAA